MGIIYTCMGFSIGVAFMLFVAWADIHTAHSTRELLAQCAQELPRNQTCELVAKPKVEE